jgi:hypothetical protein
MSTYTREQFVDNMWERVQQVAIHPISTPDSYLIHIVTHDQALLIGVLRACFDRGGLARAEGKSSTSNPYDVEGLNTYGTACQACWNAGWLATEEPEP